VLSDSFHRDDAHVNSIDSPGRYSTPRRTVCTTALVALSLLTTLTPAPADAQVRRGRAVQTGPTWAPVSIGIRFGWDQGSNGEVVGAQLRIPLLRSGQLEFVPGAAAVFPNQGRESQYNLEAHYVPGGVRGGVFLGGGVGWRNTVFGGTPEQPRQTFFGWNLVAGGKTLIGSIQLEAQLRWVFLRNTQYRPNAASLGINIPFWKPVARQPAR